MYKPLVFYSGYTNPSPIVYTYAKCVQNIKPGFEATFYNFFYKKQKETKYHFAEKEGKSIFTSRSG